MEVTGAEAASMWTMLYKALMMRRPAMGEMRWRRRLSCQQRAQWTGVSGGLWRGHMAVGRQHTARSRKQAAVSPLQAALYEHTSENVWPSIWSTRVQRLVVSPCGVSNLLYHQR